MAYFLVGPINSGDTVALSHQGGTALYILNTYKDDQGNTQIFFDSNVTGILTDQAATVPTFSLTGSGNSVNLQGPDGGLSWDADFNAGLAIIGQTFNQIQNTYQPWSPPALSLTGVSYEAMTPDNHPILFKLGAMGATGPVFTGDTTSEILYLPMTWFFGCSGNNCQSNSSIDGTILSNYCSITNDPTNCNGVQTSGFTQLSDAVVGVRYQYCALGTNCSSNCNGPCTSSLDDCEFNSSNGQFACTFDPNNIVKPGFWEQPWFIITVIVFVVLIIILLIVLFLRKKKREN